MGTLIDLTNRRWRYTLDGTLLERVARGRLYFNGQRKLTREELCRQAQNQRVRGEYLPGR